MITLEVNNTILEFFRKKSSNSFIFYVYPRCDLSIMLIMAKTEQDSEELFAQESSYLVYASYGVLIFDRRKLQNQYPWILFFQSSVNPYQRRQNTSLLQEQHISGELTARYERGACGHLCPLVQAKYSAGVVFQYYL